VISGDAATNWRFFKAQWDNYEIATGLDEKADKVRIATLLSAVGRDCYRVYENLALTEEERKTTKTIIKALDEYFEPKRNTIYERFVFNSAKQEDGEKVDEYVNRLRQLASTCDFKDLSDELVRDRIVLGISDNAARARMLREGDLTLNDAIKQCKISEATRARIDKINPPEHSESVNFAKTSKRKHKKNPRKCTRCGEDHARRDKCPAEGAECFTCGRLNHFQKMCFFKDKGRRGNKRQESRSHKEKVNKVVESESYLESDSDSSVLCITHDINSVNTMLCAAVKLNGHETNAQIDTGATCNVITKKAIHKILLDCQTEIKPSKSKLRMYDGSELKNMGIVKLECTYKNVTKHLTFHVVDVKSSSADQLPLLSAKACDELKIIDLSPLECHAVNVENQPWSEEQILSEYKDVFTGLGCLPGKYQLELKDGSVPVQHKPRRVAVAMKEPLRMKIKELEDRKILKKVTEPSDWISSLVVVKKPNKLRVCMDPSDLNAVLKRPHYQIPTVEELLPELNKAKVFTVLDAKDGFLQVELDEKSSKLTTMWTPFGRYRWLRLPFGIAPAPEEFQRRQHEFFEGMSGVAVIADDVLVYGCGETQELAIADHDKNLKHMLDKCRSVNLKLNKKKLKLRLEEVVYMGHKLTKDGVKADPSKTTAITELPTPTNVTQLQTFLGCVTYLAKFLPKLTEVCSPLRELTVRDAEWQWLPKHQEAVEKLKMMVAAPPVLKFYDVTRPVTLQTDASEKGLGATLLQDGQPVIFASRALTKTEQQYAQIEKECLAICFGCERFHQYLMGRDDITAETDHKPLETIFKKPLLEAPKRLQRMRLQLQKFMLNVVYKKGSKMYVADFLSRVFLPGKQQSNGLCEHQVLKLEAEDAFYDEVESVSLSESARVSGERRHQIQRATSTDVNMQCLMNTILSGWPETKKEVPINIQDYWNFRDELCVQNGIIFKGMRLVVPQSLRAEMLQRIHMNHMGIESCLRKAKDAIFWPNMGKEITNTVQNCSTCLTFAANQQAEPLLTPEIPTLPWKKVAIDIFTHKRADYLVTVDYYSDYFELDKLEDTSSSTIIGLLKMHFARHGIPQELMSDNAANLTSAEFQKFSREWEFSLNTSSPYHSQSNGKAESAVKIAKSLVKKANHSGQDIWRCILDWRNTPIEGIGWSAVQRLMSRRTRTTLPIAEDLLRPTVPGDVVEKIKTKRRKAKMYHDRHARPLPELQHGQPVYVKSRNNPEQWIPGQCVQQLSPRSYMVDMNGKNYRRNRIDLRQAPMNKCVQVERLDEPPVTPDNQESVERTPSTPVSVPGPSETVQVPSSTTPVRPAKTRTRCIRPPKRYEDFVTK
jgi:transposase InsO family protein